MPPRLTPTIRKVLAAASRHPEGILPDGLSTRIQAQIHESGWAERPLDASPQDAHRPTITPAGRRAILTTSQLNALTTAAPTGRLAPNVVWQTSRSLGELRLVHFWDEGTQSFHETDGDTGVSRPTRSPYRTDLGRQVAELSSRPD